jgi:hypothetical protein
MVSGGHPTSSGGKHQGGGEIARIPHGFMPRILAWFERKLFGMRPGPGSTRTRLVPHPIFHAYVRTLFWTGLRPSESGLQWGDMGLDAARLHVQRSRHLYEDGALVTEERRAGRRAGQRVGRYRAIRPFESICSAST